MTRWVISARGQVAALAEGRGELGSRQFEPPAMARGQSRTRGCPNGKSARKIT